MRCPTALHCFVGSVFCIIAWIPLGAVSSFLHYEHILLLVPASELGLAMSADKRVQMDTCMQRCMGIIPAHPGFSSQTVLVMQCIDIQPAGVG